jgi:hypothetical protein
MKIKKLEEWGPKELLIFGIVFIFIGFTLGSLLKDKEIVTELLFILIIFTGLIFFVVGLGKLLIKLEQQRKIKILREESPTSFKKFIFVIIIPLLISVLIYYWFEIRPRQIALKCFKEAIMNKVDFFSTSSEKNIMEEKYQECLKKYNLEK